MYQDLTIVGYVGSKPELKYTQDGIAVTNFSMAVNRVWKDAQGNKQEQATWYRVACWRKLAEIVSEHVDKGKLVLVVASQLKASAYTARDGSIQASLEVTADMVKFLSTTNEQRQTAPSGNDMTPPDDTNDIPF